MKNQKNLKNKLKLWLTVAVVIIIVVLGMVQSVKKSDKKDSSSDMSSSIAVNENDWVRGDINSKVVIVEYADFQCPACGLYHPLIKQVEEKFGDSIAVVFRHFPLTQIHQNALIAAQATEAAGMQGKFFEMHDIIFETQSVWSDDSRAQDIFVDYAKQLGLNEEQFLNDIKSKVVKDKIAQSYKVGTKLGVNGTPTFFMNGKKIDNPRSFEEFETLISIELAK
jgi:protein-disulfide isomerase